MAAGSVVMDPSFQFEGRFRNWLAMLHKAADAKNYERRFIFELGVDSWKQHATTNPSVGKPIPEKPTVPELVTIDEAKAREAFARWASHPEFVEGLNIGGDGPKKDYEIWTLMEVSPDTWKLGDDDAPQPVDRVSQIDISTKGRYNIAPGDRTPAGQPYQHPKYGNLVRGVMPSIMGPLHFWMAADADALNIWHRVYYERIMGVS